MDAPHGILWWLVLGILAGWITGKVMRGAGYGVLPDLILGMVGALVGGWIAHAFGLATVSMFGGLIVAVLGAILVVALFRALTGRSVT